MIVVWLTAKSAIDVTFSVRGTFFDKKSKKQYLAQFLKIIK
jgi:hypothetical protein